MIAYSYTKGTETNYSWAQSEKQYLKAKKKLEKKGFKVNLLDAKTSR